MALALFKSSARILLALLASVALASAQPSVDASRVRLGTAGNTTTLRSGTGAPSGSLGAVNDVYVRTDSPYTIYQKTGASTWSEVYRQGGTDVAVADGGTGVSSWATGDLLYASGTTTLAGITDVGAGSLLVSNSGIPGWSVSPTVSGTLTAQTSLSTPTVTHSANLAISPVGDVLFDPTGNDVRPSTNFDLNFGLPTHMWLTGHFAELNVGTIVAEDILATIGGRILTLPTTKLTSDLSNVATSIAVEHNQIASGDRLLLMTAPGGVPQIEWMAATSGPSGGGPYTYTVTRDLDGTGANTWYAGDAVANTGTTGDGFIDQYAYSSVIGGSRFGPTIVGMVRTGTTYNDIDARWAIGNLNGWYGYSSDTYGVGLGDNANAWVKVDPTNGVRIGEAGNTYFQVDPSGNATFAGRLTIGTGRNWLSNTEFRNEPSASFGQSVGSSSATSGPQTGVSGTRASGAGGGDNRYWIGAFYSGTGSPTWEWRCNNVTYPTGSGGCAFYEFSGGGVPSASSVKQVIGPSMAAAAGQYFEFSFYSLASSPISSVCARIAFYDSAGTSISTVGGNTCATSNPGGGGTLANWVRVWGYGVAPSGATSALPYIEATYNGTDADSAIFLTRMFFGEAGAAQTTPTPWAPGGITTVDGSMIATSLVVASTLKSAQTVTETAVDGFWIDGAAATKTFRVGTATGATTPKYVRWDGTNLTVKSDRFTIDSGGVTISPETTGITFVPGAAYKWSVSGSPAEMGLSGTELAGSNIVTLQNNVPSTKNAQTELLATYNSGTSSSVQLTAGSSGSVVTIAASLYTQFGSGTGNPVVFRHNNSTITNAPFLRGDGNYLIINSRSNANGGAVFIGYDTSADVNLTNGGGTTRISTGLQLVGLASCTLVVDGSGNVGCSSDADLKRDVMDYKPGLSALRELRPVSFRWAPTESATALTPSVASDVSRRVGFLAQDVRRVLPEAVSEQSWGRGGLTLDDRAILAVIVNAVKELEQEVSQMKRRQR